jgi:molybdopterin synthase sulfur carrier subunit
VAVQPDTSTFNSGEKTAVKIRVRYFAILKEERGLGGEEIVTGASTLADLYNELAVKHRFSLHQKQLRVAVNESFVDWQTAVEDGAQIVFIPPVAGG